MIEGMKEVVGKGDEGSDGMGGERGVLGKRREGK